MRLNVLDHGQRRPARSPSPGRPVPPSLHAGLRVLGGEADTLL
jgi:hypothetical protein